MRKQSLKHQLFFIILPALLLGIALHLYESADILTGNGIFIRLVACLLAFCAVTALSCGLSVRLLHVASRRAVVWMGILSAGCFLLLFAGTLVSEYIRYLLLVPIAAGLSALLPMLLHFLLLPYRVRNRKHLLLTIMITAVSLSGAGLIMSTGFFWYFGLGYSSRTVLHGLVSSAVLVLTLADAMLDIKRGTKWLALLPMTALPFGLWYLCRLFPTVTKALFPLPLCVMLLPEYLFILKLLPDLTLWTALIGESHFPIQFIARDGTMIYDCVSALPLGSLRSETLLDACARGSLAISADTELESHPVTNGYVLVHQNRRDRNTLEKSLRETEEALQYYSGIVATEPALQHEIQQEAALEASIHTRIDRITQVLSSARSTAGITAGSCSDAGKAALFHAVLPLLVQRECGIWEATEAKVSMQSWHQSLFRLLRYADSMKIRCRLNRTARGTLAPDHAAALLRDLASVLRFAFDHEITVLEFATRRNNGMVSCACFSEQFSTQDLPSLTADAFCLEKGGDTGIGSNEKGSSLYFSVPGGESDDH